MELLELLKRRNIWLEKDGNRLIVFDDVYLYNTQLKEFPSCPIVFFGNVDISNTQIKEFSNCPITFFGSLDISYTQIKKLPKCSMIFNGCLNICHTQIKELPDYIIKGYLNIDGTSITKIPKKLVAYRIYTPFKGRLFIYIQKDGKIGIGRYKKSTEEWDEFFKERKPFDNNPDLPLEEYDIVEQDFKTAVKLYESWNS